MAIEQVIIYTCDHRHCSEQILEDRFNAPDSDSDTQWRVFTINLDNNLIWCPKHAMTAYNLGLLDEAPF